MQQIDLQCPPIGGLKVPGHQVHNGHDFAIRSNAQGPAIDFLLFFDSRGVSREFEDSLAERLIAEISQMGKSYILICRPLELTIWATLIGFLAINELNPIKIVTNMGFVDFTPKKHAILLDAVDQVESIVGKDIAKTRFSENYISEGKTIPLYSLRYSDHYQRSIESIARQHKLIIINTPLVDPTIEIERKRPSSFFSAIIESNTFNRSIDGALVIDLPKFDKSLTYDAVHYTHCGNKLIFNKVKKHL